MAGGELAALGGAVIEPAGLPPHPALSPLWGARVLKEREAADFVEGPLAPHRGERGSGQGGKPAEAEKP